MIFWPLLTISTQPKKNKVNVYLNQMYWTKPQKNHFCFVFLHTFDDHDWHVLDVCACVCNQCTISTLLTLFFFSFFSNEHSTGNSLNSQMNVPKEKVFFSAYKLSPSLAFVLWFWLLTIFKSGFYMDFQTLIIWPSWGYMNFHIWKNWPLSEKKTKMVEKICSNIICVWA